jgi:hypothetical protein
MVVTCCRYHIDYEDTTEDTFPEAVRRLETNETGVANGSVNGNSINNDSDPYDFEDKEKKELDEVSSGLAQAIVKSILSLGKAFVCRFYFERLRLPVFRHIPEECRIAKFSFNFLSYYLVVAHWCAFFSNSCFCRNYRTRGSSEEALRKYPAGWFSLETSHCLHFVISILHILLF